MISMSIQWSLWVYNDLYENTIISMSIQWSLWVYNDLYVFWNSWGRMKKNHFCASLSPDTKEEKYIIFPERNTSKHYIFSAREEEERCFERRESILPRLYRRLLPTSNLIVRVQIATGIQLLNILWTKTNNPLHSKFCHSTMVIKYQLAISAFRFKSGQIPHQEIKMLWTKTNNSLYTKFCLGSMVIKYLLATLSSGFKSRHIPQLVM